MTQNGFRRFDERRVNRPELNSRITNGLDERLAFKPILRGVDNGISIKPYPPNDERKDRGPGNGGKIRDLMIPCICLNPSFNIDIEIKLI